MIKFALMTACVPAGLAIAMAARPLETAPHRAESHDNKLQSYDLAPNGISEEWSSDYTRLTLKDILGQDGYRYFTLQSPPRIVIDVLNPPRQVAADSLPLRDVLFKKLRVGKYFDHIRYVLDLSGGDIHSKMVRSGSDLIIEAKHDPLPSKANMKPAQVAGSAPAKVEGTDVTQQKKRAEAPAPAAAIQESAAPEETTEQESPSTGERVRLTGQQKHPGDGTAGSAPVEVEGIDVIQLKEGAEAPAPAAAVQKTAAKETIRQEIQSTSDKMKLAALYKQLGDQCVSRDKIEDAAKNYLKALSCCRESFSVQDRLRMSIYISWTDRLDDAMKELQLIIKESPDDLEARTHLARVLSWKGKLAESIEEADKVLQQSPDDIQAQLVKADALQWQGSYKEAIPIYQGILQRGENFEARKGLSYSFLAVGRLTWAEESSSILKPVSPKEQGEARKLTDAIGDEIWPRLDLLYNHYTDSDDNYLDRYRLSLGSWVWGKLKADLDYSHTDAQDKTRNGRAEDASLSASSNLTDRFSIGGGLGFNQLDFAGSANSLTGHFKLGAKIFKGNLGVSFSSDLLSDTAQLIENRIRMTTLGFSVSQPLTDRISLSADYREKDFSDKNSAHDVGFVSQYRVYSNPRVYIGYRFRFLDFKEQSESGFFDPNDYISNRFFNSLYLERKSFYLYSEYYLGQQHFRRYGSTTSDFVYGGSGSVGFKPTQKISLEFNVEGGNFAAGTVSGFNYFTLGPRVLVRF